MEQLTASQLAEWEAYDRLDPISDFRMEAVLAQGLSIIANLLLKAHFKSGTKEFEPKDFLVDWTGELKEEQERKQSVEEMKQFILGFAKKQNERVARKHLKKQKK